MGRVRRVASPGCLRLMVLIVIAVVHGMMTMTAGMRGHVSVRLSGWKCRSRRGRNRDERTQHGDDTEHGRPALAEQSQHFRILTWVCAVRKSISENGISVNKC